MAHFLFGIKSLPEPMLSTTQQQQQAIVWTIVDSSSAWSSDIHLRAISQDIPQPSVTKISLKIAYLKFQSNLSGANDLKLSRSQWVNPVSHVSVRYDNGNGLRQALQRYTFMYIFSFHIDSTLVYFRAHISSGVPFTNTD